MPRGAHRVRSIVSTGPPSRKMRAEPVDARRPLGDAGPPTTSGPGPRDPRRTEAARRAPASRAGAGERMPAGGGAELVPVVSRYASPGAPPAGPTARGEDAPQPMRERLEWSLGND